MKLIRVCITICVMMSIAAPSAADEDTILWVDANGSISGLPQEFSPAFAHFAYGRNDWSERVVSSLSLSVAGSQISIPPCLLRALKLGADKELEFSFVGSLDVPPMILIDFPTGNTDSGVLAHVVLLSLDNLDIEKIWRVRAVGSGRKIEIPQLSAICASTKYPYKSLDDRHY